jgi:hypothetical protein
MSDGGETKNEVKHENEQQVPGQSHQMASHEDAPGAGRALTEEEHVQMSHVTIVNSHANAVSQLIQQGAPAEVVQVHTEALLESAINLSNHTDAVVYHKAEAKEVELGTAPTKAEETAVVVAPASEPSSSNSTLYVAAALAVVAAVAYITKTHGIW